MFVAFHKLAIDVQLGRTIFAFAAVSLLVCLLQCSQHAVIVLYASDEVGVRAGLLTESPDHIHGAVNTKATQLALARGRLAQSIQPHVGKQADRRVVFGLLVYVGRLVLELLELVAQPGHARHYALATVEFGFPVFFGLVVRVFAGRGKACIAHVLTQHLGFLLVLGFGYQMVLGVRDQVVERFAVCRSGTVSVCGFLGSQKLWGLAHGNPVAVTTCRRVGCALTNFHQCVVLAQEPVTLCDDRLAVSACCTLEHVVVQGTSQLLDGVFLGPKDFVTVLEDVFGYLLRPRRHCIEHLLGFAGRLGAVTPLTFEGTVLQEVTQGTLLWVAELTHIFDGVICHLLEVAGTRVARLQQFTVVGECRHAPGNTALYQVFGEHKAIKARVHPAVSHVSNGAGGFLETLWELGDVLLHHGRFFSTHTVGDRTQLGHVGCADVTSCVAPNIHLSHTYAIFAGHENLFSSDGLCLYEHQAIFVVRNLPHTLVTQRKSRIGADMFLASEGVIRSIGILHVWSQIFVEQLVTCGNQSG